jgi:predicted exporter
LSYLVQLRISGLFEQVGDGEHDAWADIGRWLFDRRYLLSPATTPEHFTPQACAKASRTRCRCWARRPAPWSSRC